MAYAQMLNTYLNIIKYVQMAEPKAMRRKDQRDRITHPRSVVELSDDAHRYAAMLEEHRGSGDVLESKEVTFLEVFSKIDDLRANGVGNLC